MDGLVKRIRQQHSSHNEVGCSTNEFGGHDPVDSHFDGKNHGSTGVHLAFDKSPVATVLTSLAGHIVQANRAFQQVFGLAAMAEAGTDILSICHDKITLDFLDALARDGVVRQEKLVIKLPDKAPLDVLCTASRIDGEDNIPCWLIITFDRRINSSVSQPQKLNAALLSSELEALAEAGYWQLHLRDDADVMECGMEWSSGMFALLDCKPGAARTLKHWLNKVAPADRAMVAAALRNIALLGGTYDIEYRVSARDGAQTLRGKAKRIEAPSALGGIMLIGVEQRIASHADNRHQDAGVAYILQTVVESSEAPIYAIDREMRLVCSNDAFRTALGQGMTGEAVSLADLTSRLPDIAQRQRVVKNLRRALNGQTRIEVAEMGGGELGGRWYDFTYNPVRSADGEVIGVAVLGVDVSARHAVANGMPVQRIR